jgi:hypothetical protein
MEMMAYRRGRLWCLAFNFIIGGRCDRVLFKFPDFKECSLNLFYDALNLHNRMKYNDF